MNARDKIKFDLQAKIIVDLLNNQKSLLCSSAWNSKNEVIRFTTKKLESLFKSKTDTSGYWRNGKKAFYEIKNDLTKLTIRCVIDYKSLNSLQTKEFVKITNNINEYYENDLCVFNKWDIDTDDLNKNLNSFIKKTLKEFESSIKEEANKKTKDDEIFEGDLTEGDLIRLATIKYERNPEARQKCLDYYGYECQICGFNFEKTYGKKFKNIIEVHHIKPLSTIKENYIVDPIKDLIPVCPNCHTALHSKEDGVYLPKDIIKNLNIRKDN